MFLRFSSTTNFLLYVTHAYKGLDIIFARVLNFCRLPLNLSLGYALMIEF
jgi:hypothetical protein